MLNAWSSIFTCTQCMVIQTKVLNCKLTLHWQAIFCTWGLRMSSSTWHKSTIHCVGTPSYELILLIYCTRSAWHWKHICTWKHMHLDKTRDKNAWCCNKHLTLDRHVHNDTTRKHLNLLFISVFRKFYYCYTR